MRGTNRHTEHCENELIYYYFSFDFFFFSLFIYFCNLTEAFTEASRRPISAVLFYKQEIMLNSEQAGGEDDQVVNWHGRLRVFFPTVVCRFLLLTIS